jgi:hypothetical protein
MKAAQRGKSALWLNFAPDIIEFLHWEAGSAMERIDGGKLRPAK